MRDVELETTRRVMSHLGRIARENKLSLNATFPDEKTFVLTAIALPGEGCWSVAAGDPKSPGPSSTKSDALELFRVQDGSSMVQLTKLEEDLPALCKKHKLKFVP